MKLLRHGPAGQEKPGVLDSEGSIRDLSSYVGDLSPDVIADELKNLQALDIDALPKAGIAGMRLGPPVANIGKIVCVGLNYRDHAAESGMAAPDEPVLFMKATSAICGPNDKIILPRGFSKADWEVELGVVIGATARYVTEQQALEHVAGYCICNDVSERAFQLEHEGQWVKGKSADTFAPLGPWLVTADEIIDPHDLNLWLEVNGRRYQEGNTCNFIFNVPQIISYISRFMTLNPGDVISTGTPPGVGMGQRPPVYLQPGDEMRLGIDGLGAQSQHVVAYS